MTKLELHRDALFPSGLAARSIARDLYATVSNAPIVSPHGHVSAASLAANDAFADPAQLFITPDHYVTRVLHASGIGFDQLGLGGSDADPREVWSRLCSGWHLFAGTPVRYWLEYELGLLFNVTERPSAANADDLYDLISAALAEPAFRPRALLTRFGIKILATTDDPADDLAAHRQLAADETFDCTVVPTMRADVYMRPDQPAWREHLRRLEDAGGENCGTYRQLLKALRLRREQFIAHGATSTDCGTVDAWAVPLSDDEAERLHRDGLAGTLSSEGADAYRRNMLYQFAAMAADDGLVMQLHAGVLRNHHVPTLLRFGPDTGHDLPTTTNFNEPLRQVLNDFGTASQFRIVLFTVDETAFARDIAPLAAFYPSVYAGAPWWFLDAPAAILRCRAAVAETAGFYKTSGFIDDTRALCSIPARHDMSRRLDARYLAELVATHQLGEEEALGIIRDLVSEIPMSTFRFDRKSGNAQ